MPNDSEVPLLIVSGTVGVGKSTVLDAMHDTLCAADLPHACIDLDALGLSWPIRGVFNQTSIVENLGSLWANFRAAGARRLAVAGVVEQPEDLAALQGAVPGARATLCQLLASEPTRLARLRQREIGAGLDWHVRRTTELQTILDSIALHDFTVLNEERTVRDVAREVLVRAGWLPTSSALDIGTRTVRSNDDESVL
jgi:adenylylsulfate kinase